MTYDANGNTLNDGTNTYVWDARNRLVSANNNGASFSYDPLGRRTEKNLLSASTSFLYDGVNPVQELNGSTVTANLLNGGIDEHFTRTDSSGTSNFLTDALGSTVALTDPSGNLTTQYSYGPFGSISINGTTTNSYTYTGRESDGLGLYYYRARYYNPQIGRFLSEDPSGFIGGVNAYAYVGDDPLDSIDPFGLDKNAPPDAQQKSEHSKRECLMDAFDEAIDQHGTRFLLDAAGLGLDALDFLFPDGGEMIKLALATSVNLTAFVNSGQENDAAGSVSSVLGGQTAIIGWRANSVGVSWAHYIPFVSTGIDLVSLGGDLLEVADDYRGCLTRNGL